MGFLEFNKTPVHKEFHYIVVKIYVVKVIILTNIKISWKYKIF